MLDDVAESFAFDVTRVGLLKNFFILSQSVLYRIADPEKRRLILKNRLIVSISGTAQNF